MSEETNLILTSLIENELSEKDISEEYRKGLNKALSEVEHLYLDR